MAVAGGDVARAAVLRKMLWMDFYLHMRVVRERQEHEAEQWQMRNSG